MKKVILRKRICKIAVIVLMFCVCTYFVREALSFKYGDGILGIEMLYKQEKDTIDVLILGSSHAFENINTAVLFDSYGIASYVLAGSVQPYWNSYYYLMEALKTQHPKLIILEAYGSAFNQEYSDHSRIIKNNLGIKDPIARAQSLMVSSPRDELENYFWDYRLWHSRYTELNASDASKYWEKPIYKYYKGFGINFATDSSLIRPDIDHIETGLSLYPKSEKYLRKIIELAKQENIPLLIVVSPFILSDNNQQQFIETKKIAGEYDVDFINFNESQYYDLMNLDFAMDFADSAHLNYRGNVKYTNVLAKMILNRYDIPYHSMDEEKYITWKLNSKDILGRTENEYLRKENDFSAYLNHMEKENYRVILVTEKGTEKLFKNPESKLLGIEAATLMPGRLYEFCNGRIEEYISDPQWSYQKELGNEMLEVEHSFVQNGMNLDIPSRVIWNGKEIISGEPGCYFIVYDIFSEELVEICRFYLDAEENEIKKQRY